MPLKYLLMLAFAYAYITFIAVYIVKIDSEAVFYLYCTIYGMYLIVLWTHIYNITYYLKNWKNKEYWKKLEELKSIS